MKALKILGIALVAIILCGPVMGQTNRELRQEIKKEKNKAKLEEARQKTRNAKVGTTPCSQAAFDDNEFYRGLGVGTHANERQARGIAIRAAKDEIKQKMPEFVQNVTSAYFNAYGGSAPTDDAQSKLENLANGVIEGMLNDARTVCDNYEITERQDYHYWIAMEIPKNELRNRMVEALSKDEKLSIDFNKAQFQKFMDERMNGMLDAKKNAGY